MDELAILRAVRPAVDARELAAARSSAKRRLAQLVEQETVSTTRGRWRAPRRRWLVIAAVVVLGVGFSRVALGAHYVTDVLAGIGLGLIWLVVCSKQIRTLGVRQSDEGATTTNLAVDCSARAGGGGALDGALD